MTLVEFLSPIFGNRNRDRCLAVLAYKQRYEQQVSMTAQQIQDSLVDARAPNARKLNVPDILQKSGPLVDSAPGPGKARLWTLTKAGQSYLQKLNLLGPQPEIERELTLLRTLTTKIANHDVREYFDEAIKCMEVGALRAAIVFVWTGAIRTLQEKCLAKGLREVNGAILTHDPKARQIKKLDDFAYVKDSVQLLAAEGVGVLDKGQRTTLGEALDLRNRCGHPTKYSPGIKKASSFLEDVLGILYR